MKEFVDGGMNGINDGMKFIDAISRILTWRCKEFIVLLRPFLSLRK